MFEKSIDYSVYPIAIGDTNLLKDAKITNLKYNDISFLYNTFPMEISIKSIGCLGDESELSVWHENKKIYSKIILFDSNNFYSNEKVTEVVIPAFEGEIGILKDHINLISFLFLRAFNC